MAPRDAFLGALAPEVAARFADLAALDALLAEHLAAAHAAWPDIACGDDEVAAHVASRLGADASLEALAATRTADVYLALACAHGDAAAIARFEATYFGEIDAAAARTRATPDTTAEVKARLRRVLFVGDGERRPATAEFAGRGDLRGWIRVAATREIVHLIRKRDREIGIDDAELFDILSPAADPEAAYIRDMYRAEFAAAFQAALATLTPRQKSLLRYQVIDGLGSEEIGAIHGVHRATANRWLAEARAVIAETTRSELARRLGAAAVDVDSIIRLVRSRLDVSLERNLL